MPEPTGPTCCTACAARGQTATLIRERDEARAERDQLAAALDRAASIRIDAHGVIWHAAPDGHWRHRIYGARTLDQVDAIFGQTSPALLVPIDDDVQADEQPAPTACPGYPVCTAYRPCPVCHPGATGRPTCSPARR